MPVAEIELGPEDREIQMRSTTLRVGSGKRITFPRRSFCLTRESDSESHLIKNPQIRGVNEIPRRITKDQILDIDSDEGKQERFYSDIGSRFRSVNSADEVNMFIFSYFNGPKLRDKPKVRGPNRTPSRTETEYLVGLLEHRLFNDIWVPPIINGLKGSEYVPYLQDFYDIAKRRNAAVAGLIPRFGRQEIRQLVNVFIENEINYLVMDFDNRNPLALVGNINLTMAIKDALEERSGRPCFVHGVNVPFYRGLWQDEVLPARDIILFGMGFDCFGSSHVFRPWHPMDKEKLEHIKNEPKRFRLFNRQDYGYHRDDTIKAKDFEESIDVSVTVSMVQEMAAKRHPIQRQATRALESAFNAERHGLEAEEIRRKLVAGQRLSKHLAEKPHLPRSVLDRLFRSS